MRKPNIIGLGEYEIEDLLEELRQRTDVSRLEIIDHTPCATCDGKGIVVAENYSISGHVCSTCCGRKMIGRQVVMWDKNKKVNLSVQDDGITMKMFITNISQKKTVDALFDTDKAGDVLDVIIKTNENGMEE